MPQTNKIIKIEGMSCEHCANSVKNALEELDGISKVEVSLNNKNAQIEYDDSKLNIETILNTIKELEYNASIE